MDPYSPLTQGLFILHHLYKGLDTMTRKEIHQELDRQLRDIDNELTLMKMKKQDLTVKKDSILAFFKWDKENKNTVDTNLPPALS